MKYEFIIGVDPGLNYLAVSLLDSNKKLMDFNCIEQEQEKNLENKYNNINRKFTKWFSNFNKEKTIIILEFPVL